ncbi:MAG TPA: class I SAM-dependent methyltransferase [Bradyrhizobium sp.]|nr:class I SAM-dependent methyltransferase [Bradyrhizobium sp.]
MSGATDAVHRAAADGYAAKADAYVRGRPDYPDDILGWLRGNLDLGPGKVVVDLGAGTGKFTAYLRKTGARVIAVEPVAEMRQKLSASFPDVEALAGTAQAIPLPDASVDALTCATAFHWFATTETMREIHRVLKPGGKLGLIWNVRDESVAWVKEVARIVNAYEGDVPRQASGAWKKAFPFEGIGPLQEVRFPHGHTGSPEDVIVNRARTVSFIAALPKEEEAKVVAQVRALIAAEPSLAGRTTVTMPYVTTAYSATKIG